MNKKINKKIKTLREKSWKEKDSCKRCLRLEQTAGIKPHELV